MAKRIKIAKILMLLVALALIGMLASLFINVEQKDPERCLTVYHEGREYRVLDRGDEPMADIPTYFVRYISVNPADEAVRSAECIDLYAIIAKHIDTNKHQRVMIYAVAQKPRLFGLLPPVERVVSSSAEDVLKYKPAKVN